MIKCSQCGFENKDGADFCLNCGAPVTASMDEEEDFNDVSDEATVLINPAAMQARMQSEMKEKGDSKPTPKIEKADQSGAPQAPQQSSQQSSGASNIPDQPSAPTQQQQLGDPPQMPQGGGASNSLTIILLSLIILVVLIIVALVIFIFLK